MKPGTISTVIDYYFENSSHQEDITRAMKEFFGVEPGDELELTMQKEKAFNEWFVFDFELSNGRTPLEDYYKENPEGLDMVERQVYKDLQENQFSLYKVKGVFEGEGLVLEDLYTEKTYNVREHSATFDLREGQVFSTRVGRIGNVYEMVSGTALFGPIKLNDQIEQNLLQDDPDLNPKKLRDILSTEEEKQSSSEFDLMQESEEYPSLEQAKADLKQVLNKYELDKFVDVETLQEWNYNSYFSFEEDCMGVNMLYSLINDPKVKGQEALSELIHTFNIFYNLCPQKELDGNSPLESRQQREKQDKNPDIKLSMDKIPSGHEWADEHKQAIDHMQNGELGAALDKFRYIFNYLFEHKISTAELYRLYTNKGACHLAKMEIDASKLMLEIATELNPNYKFAKQQLRRVDKFLFADSVDKDELASDDIVGYEYYQFIKLLEIDFAHKVDESGVIKRSGFI